MHHLVIDDDWEDVHAHVLLPALMRRYLPLVTYYRYIRATKTDTYMLQTRCQCTNSQSTMNGNTCRFMSCRRRQCAGTAPRHLITICMYHVMMRTCCKRCANAPPSNRRCLGISAGVCPVAGASALVLVPRPLITIYMYRKMIHALAQRLLHVYVYRSRNEGKCEGLAPATPHTTAHVPSNIGR